MVKFSISTLNVRGINKKLKRFSIFSKCLDYDISFLQESYITEDKFPHWQDEWKGKLFYSPGTNNSNGLITLINEKFSNNTESVFYKSGRVLGISILIDTKSNF